MALEIEGLTVRDVVIETREAVNPEPGGPTFVTVPAVVRGALEFAEAGAIDWPSRNATLDALKAALEAEHGPGRYEGGIGGPGSPDNPFVGYFSWTLTRP